MRFDVREPFDGPDDARCRVCGREAKLTFEHLPPKGAGNTGRAEMLGLDQWLRRVEHGEAERGKIVQRGSGAYTLCEPCNNRAGALYVPELIEWTERAGVGLFNGSPSVEELDKTLEPAYAVARFEQVRPARFLKQMVTMLLALASPGFPPRNPDLTAFAQDPEWVGLPPNYQFYLVLYAGPTSRFNGGGVVLRRTAEGFRNTFTMELSYPPFSYVLSVDEETAAVEAGNITRFADLGIHERTSVKIPMRVGFGHTVFPLDYRTRAMVDETIRQNQAAA